MDRETIKLVNVASSALESLGYEYFNLHEFDTIKSFKKPVRRPKKLKLLRHLAEKEMYKIKHKLEQYGFEQISTRVLRAHNLVDITLFIQGGYTYVEIMWRTLEEIQADWQSWKD